MQSKLFQFAKKQALNLRVLYGSGNTKKQSPPVKPSFQSRCNLNKWGRFVVYVIRSVAFVYQSEIGIANASNGLSIVPAGENKSHYKMLIFHKQTFYAILSIATGSGGECFSMQVTLSGGMIVLNTPISIRVSLSYNSMFLTYFTE